MYFVNIFIITRILLYIILIRDFFNVDSLIIKFKVINNYIYSSNIKICSFL